MSIQVNDVTLYDDATADNGSCEAALGAFYVAEINKTKTIVFAVDLTQAREKLIRVLSSEDAAVLSSDGATNYQPRLAYLDEVQEWRASVLREDPTEAVVFYYSCKTYSVSENAVA